MKKLNPLCVDSNDKTDVRGIAYCSNGWLLPCCWLDSPAYKEELSKHGLYNESLKLENNNSVYDIVNSDEWVKFIDLVSNGDYDSTPEKCRRQCGK